MFEEARSVFAVASPGTQLSAWSLGERRRLQAQFDLLRDDFDMWFDRTLRYGELTDDPGAATWRVLDAGCGRGHFSRRIGSRFPGTAVTGFDIDEDAVGDAATQSVAMGNVRFLAHDGTGALPAEAVPAGGYDVAFAWLVLMWAADGPAMLRTLSGALRPGAAVLLANLPDDFVHYSHPAATRLFGAAQGALRRAGALGLEERLDADLRDAGFEQITHVVARHPLGGATAEGQRWWSHWLVSLASARRAVVDVHGLMDGVEFDHHVERLAALSTVEQAGHFDHLYTLARKAGR